MRADKHAYTNSWRLSTVTCRWLSLV